MKAVKPIRTKKEYSMALKRVDTLIKHKPKKGSKEYDELDVLGTLLSAYEDFHFPIMAPNPVDAIKNLMEEEGLKQKDLIEYFGSKGNVSEFLNNKRGLSMNIVKSLHLKFKIPYEVLMA